MAKRLMELAFKEPLVSGKLQMIKRVSADPKQNTNDSVLAVKSITVTDEGVEIRCLKETDPRVAKRSRCDGEMVWVPESNCSTGIVIEDAAPESEADAARRLVQQGRRP